MPYGDSAYTARFGTQLELYTATYVTNRRKQRDSEMRAWEAANPAILAATRCIKRSATISVAVQRVMKLVHAAPEGDLLVIVPRIRRRSSMRLMARLFQTIMLNPPCTKVLLWWHPPASDSEKGPCRILLGTPDLLYLMDGLEDGYSIPSISRIALSFTV